MRGQVLIAVSALALAAFAQPASAQQYGSYQDEHIARSQACQQSHANRTLGGAAIGGVAGAVIGNNMSSHGHHDRGSLIGGLAGALIGGAIGNSTANQQPQCQGDVAGNYDPYYGQAQPPSDDDKYASNGYGDDRYGDDDGYQDDPRAYDDDGYQDDQSGYGDDDSQLDGGPDDDGAYGK
jgi:hypothetical protein